MERFCFSLILALLVSLNGWAGKKDGSKAIYISHTTPENECEITSFSSIVLHFDFSEFFSDGQYENDGTWGIGCNGVSSKGIRLYKVTEEDDIELTSFYENVKNGADAAFQVGFDYKFSFPNIEVEPGALYKIAVRQNFYALQKDQPVDKTVQALTLKDYASSVDDAYIFYCVGSSNGLLYSVSPNTENPIKSLNDVIVSFDSDIVLQESAQATIHGVFDDSETSYALDILKSNDNEITIKGNGLTLYKGNDYILEIPAGIVSYINDTSKKNENIVLQYSGGSYHYFSLKRGLYPADGAEVIEIGNVNIPFNFPEGYGFKTTSSGPVEINADLYVGGLDGEKIDTYVFEASDADATILVGSVSTPLDAGQSYTLIVPKEQVVARNLTGIGSIEGWTNDDVVINLTTPSADAIDAVEINGEFPSQAELIDNVTLSVSPYKYKELDYDVVSCDSPVIKLFENEEEISSYPLELAKVENSTVLQTKEALNISLAKGKTYRLVLPAGTVAPDHNFLGKYAANKELSFTIEGMATGELKAEFTSNIAEGQTASHLGVVSIYTANPVAAVEGAALELRNGEEVKTAPVRVSVENGYSHIYADFSDADHKALALERATEYTVVLPQGTVTDASNESLINNEYSFSISGLEKEVEPIVPEYVSVDFMIDNYVSTSYRMVKGEPSTIKVNATDEWYLKSLTLNGEDVIENVSEEGFYTLPALETDAELAAEFSYFEDLEMTELSGIGSIENGNRNVSVYNDGSVIVIENLEAGDNVAVYTVNGMVIKSFVASKDIMYIDAPVGQVYIIRVNNGAVKLQH